MHVIVPQIAPPSKFPSLNALNDQLPEIANDRDFIWAIEKMRDHGTEQSIICVKAICSIIGACPSAFFHAAVHAPQAALDNADGTEAARDLFERLTLAQLAISSEIG